MLRNFHKLPKKKVFALTGTMIVVGYSTTYLMSDYRKYINANLAIRDLQQVEDQIKAVEFNQTRKPFQADYGLDFNKKKHSEE